MVLRLFVGLAMLWLNCYYFFSSLGSLVYIYESFVKLQSMSQLVLNVKAIFYLDLIYKYDVLTADATCMLDLHNRTSY